MSGPTELKSPASGAPPCPDSIAGLEQALANLDNGPLPPNAIELIAHNATRHQDLFPDGVSATLTWMLDLSEIHHPRDAGVADIGQLLTGCHTMMAVDCATRLHEAHSIEQLTWWIRLLRQSILDGAMEHLDVLQRQWQLVELPLTLACSLDSVLETSGIVEVALESFRELVDAALDSDGWPSANAAGDFGPLCASWFRCLRIGGLVAPSSEARSELQSLQEMVSSLARQLMRLLRGDRTLMMTTRSARLPDAMLSALLTVSTDQADHLILERTGERPMKPRPNRVALDRSRNTVSAWGRSFLFQDGWERNACKIATMFDAAGCRIEIGKKHALIQGSAFPEVSLAGQPLVVEGQPELLVSQCDDDVAFAEIQWTFHGDVKLQRHVILSMEDKFAWIGDVVLTPGSDDEIDYRCDWPLAKGITTIAESETTEGYLYDGKKIRALVVPPACPEWKVTSPTALGKESTPVASVSRLEFQPECFTLARSGAGRAMYVPLFLDLSPKRSQRPRTWRQLTVAEQLEIVPADRAVAYRVQVGKKQFVMYRSLGNSGSADHGASGVNRTFFGQNVITELFLGRLEKDRTMTELLQVE